MVQIIRTITNMWYCRDKPGLLLVESPTLPAKRVHSLLPKPTPAKQIGTGHHKRRMSWRADVKFLIPSMFNVSGEYRTCGVQHNDLWDATGRLPHETCARHPILQQRTCNVLKLPARLLFTVAPSIHYEQTWISTGPLLSGLPRPAVRTPALTSRD